MECKRKSICVFGAAIVLALVAARIGSAKQSIIAGLSELAYVATQMGVPVEGSFGRFDARVDLDPNKPEEGSVSLSVDTSSVVFPASDVLRELAKPDWFDTARYPGAEFRSTRIRALGSDRYEVEGSLTIKGRSRAVVVPVSLSRSGPTMLAAGTLTIKRLDYDVGVGDWRDTSVVENEVQVRFRIELSGTDPG